MRITTAIIAGFLAFGTLGANSPARAESTKNNLDFFSKNSALTIFDGEIATKLPKFKDPKPEPTEVKAEEQPAEAIKELGAEPAEATEAKLAPDEEENSNLRERLAKKYGDPASEPKLRVMENAPPSLKAMMEAIDAGDDEVAYEYAKQHIRYLQKYQKALGSVMQFSNEALKDSQAQNEDPTVALRKMDERVNLMLSRAEKAEMGEISVSNVQVSRDRAAIRAFLDTQKDLKPDPSGAVDIIAFFELGKENECWTIGEMRRVAKQRGADSRVTIVGASVKPVDQNLLDAIRQKTNLPFALKDGSALATKLGVTQSCSLAAIVPNQKRAIIEPGSATFEFIDELITKLQGARTV